MLRQLFLILLFSAWTSVNAAYGQWNHREAKPQRFTSTERHVIAVGEEMAPGRQIGYGPAGGVKRELDEGNVDRSTKRAFDSKGIQLAGKVTVTVQRKGEKWLIADKNNWYLVIWLFDRYDALRIYRLEVVRSSEILRALKEGKEVRLKLVLIEGALEWQGSNQSKGIRENLYFIDTTVVGPVYFRNVNFSGNVDFSGTHLIEARFYNVEFDNSFFFQEASVARLIRFRSTRCKSADFSRVHFAGDALFRGASFSEAVDFKKSRISKLIFESSEPINAELDFSETHFENEANFKGIIFNKGVKFSKAEFEGIANFKNAEFREADFFRAKFKKKADFSETKFTGEGSFSTATFSDAVDFTAAEFSSQARFSFAKFIKKDAEVSFQGTRFAQKADFSNAEISTLDLSSFIPLSKQLFKIDFDPHYQALNDGKLTERLRQDIEKNFRLSDNTSVTVIERSNAWLINDEANQVVLTVIKEKELERDRIIDKLVVNLRSISTLIDQLSLIGTSYDLMYIDSRSINRFIFDEAAFQRFLKNQKDLGREPFEYENAVLALKRYQRSQKWFLTRWIETALFDWTTQYGTAKIPWGLVIYATACVFVFTGLYRINPSFLVFVRSDGSVDDNRKDPGWLELFWFSGNTFVPAIEFLNAGNWRPRYDVMFPGGFIRYATIATIERILGWAMLPALLSYF